MPLHPEIAAFLELVQVGAENGRRPLHELPPAVARAEYDQSSPLLDSNREAINTVKAVTIPCRDGQHISGRLYVPIPSASVEEESLRPALLYFHGGGYCVGSLDSHDSLCHALAKRTPCMVLAVAYRLAPEQKFPTAFQDAEDSYIWLSDQGPSLGIDPHRIAVGGDSVGGTLATTLTLARRNASQAQPALQALLYPCTSAWQDFESHRRYAQGYLLEAATLQWMFGNYLRNEADRNNWRFAPLKAPDLSGLAPAFIALAEYDLLVDEGIAYANRLKAAGVTTHLKIYPGMVHDFARLSNIVSTAEEVRQDMANALAAAFRL